MIIVELTLTISQGARGHLPSKSIMGDGNKYWCSLMALKKCSLDCLCLKKRVEMSSDPYYRGTIISFDANCTGYYTTLTKIFKN